MLHGARGSLRFVQISDSHIGFDKPANTDVTATPRAAIAKIEAEPDPPSFVLHTGDLTHLSRPAEFDTLQQVLSELSVPVFHVPGEHDMLEDDIGAQRPHSSGDAEGRRARVFHKAMSTAFPQPAPGTAPSPGPMKVEADRLRQVLGLSRMSFHDVTPGAHATCRNRPRARDSVDMTVPIGMPMMSAISL